MVSPPLVPATADVIGPGPSAGAARGGRARASPPALVAYPLTVPAFDVAIVGAGLIGLATAYQLLADRPGLRLVVIDKERGVARHQSSHNSGVLHSGVYYP